jgi:photosystem II stability/assembly factor-like uncharacterized protein
MHPFRVLARFGVVCLTLTLGALFSAPAAVAAGGAGTAGWNISTQYPEAVNILDAIACASATTCVAVGDMNTGMGANDYSGVILGTSDGGSTWNRQAVPSGLVSVSSISCPSATTCFALGLNSSGYYDIVGTTDGGSTWNVVFQGIYDSLTPSGDTFDPVNVSCGSVTDCVIVGTFFTTPTPPSTLSEPAGGAIIATTNRWSSWAPQAAPSGVVGLSQVTCASAATCESVGFTASSTQANAIIGTSDGGSTWVGQTVVAGDTNLNGIACSSSTTCEAAGRTSNSGALVGTTDGGSTWVSQSVPAGIANLNGVACSSSTTCEAGGQSSRAGALVGTADGGTTWTRQTPPTGLTSVLDIACPSTTACEALARDPGPTAITTTDSGSSWATQAVSQGAFSLNGIACPIATTCRAVGQTDNNSYPTSYGFIVSTTDGGATWSQKDVLSANTILTGIACPTTAVCEAVGDGPSAAAIVGTTDGGSGWSSQVAPPGIQQLFGIACPTASTCEAVGVLNKGGGAILSTTDGGSTWSIQRLLSRDTYVTSIACPSATTCETVGGNSTAGVIFRTTDGGTTWSRRGLPLQVIALSGIACPATSTCKAIGYGPTGNVVLSTADRGSTWTSRSLPFAGEPVGNFGAIACRTATNCEVVGQQPLSVPPATQGTILGTADGGSTWNSQSVPSGIAALSDVACPETVTCFASGRGQGAVGAMVLSESTTPPTTSMLIPANGATVSGASVLLDAGASSPTGIGSVVFEVSGGALRHQVVGTGTSSVYGWYASWNTTGVPNGTYSLRSVATDAQGFSAEGVPITVTVKN